MAPALEDCTKAIGLSKANFYTNWAEINIPDGLGKIHHVAYSFPIGSSVIKILKVGPYSLEPREM